jgi:hypothetical protein
MGYAGQLARSYSNPESTWNSLGALGTTSAWDQSGRTAQEALYRLKNNPERQPRNRAEDAEDMRRLVQNISRYSGEFSPGLGSFRSNPQPSDYNLNKMMGLTGADFLNSANQAGDIYTGQALAGRYMRNFNIQDLF